RSADVLLPHQGRNTSRGFRLSSDADPLAHWNTGGQTLLPRGCTERLGLDSTPVHRVAGSAAGQSGILLPPIHVPVPVFAPRGFPRAVGGPLRHVALEHGPRDWGGPPVRCEPPGCATVHHGLAGPSNDARPYHAIGGRPRSVPPPGDAEPLS